MNGAEMAAAEGAEVNHEACKEDFAPFQVRRLAPAWPLRRRSPTGILSIALTRLKATDTAMMVPLITTMALWARGQRVGNGWRARTLLRCAPGSVRAMPCSARVTHAGGSPALVLRLLPLVLLGPVRRA